MSAVTNKLRRLIEGVDKLNSFESTDKIAEFFRDLGYAGAEDSIDCIVARFLKDCIGDPDAHVRVSTWDVTYRWPETTVEELLAGKTKNILNLAFGEALSAFVAKWDTGCWPELVESLVEEIKAEAETAPAP